MYFGGRRNTDIDDKLKYKKDLRPVIKKKIKRLYPYAIFLVIFIIGIMLMISGIKS